ncbi:MAG TPA: prenyltransferase/squalene oxidase repeat-containing protein [Vicinamibacteria bacterium]
MLQVARLAPRLLGESAGLVESFLRSQIDEQGAFRGRGGEGDLYYTVFGAEGLLALRADLPADSLAAYLRSCGDGAGMDLVHTACLARAWAALPPASRAPAPVAALTARLAQHRPEAQSAYALFLLVGALQDLGQPLPPAAEVLAILDGLRAGDGAYANLPGAPQGQTPATAAAVTVRRQLGAEPEAGLAEWLLARAHRDGGFFAAPDAPLPDLLSTATALHALATLQVDVGPVRESCLDFLDTLWSSRGGFFGHWADDVLDCEYTYYGLLALGHLSL